MLTSLTETLLSSASSSLSNSVTTQLLKEVSLLILVSRNSSILLLVNTNSAYTVVLVVTALALKLHEGIKDLDEAKKTNIDALAESLENVEMYLDNMLNAFNIPPVVVINCFPLDTTKRWLELNKNANLSVSLLLKVKFSRKVVKVDWLSSLLGILP